MIIVFSKYLEYLTVSVQNIYRIFLYILIDIYYYNILVFNIENIKY